MKTDAGEEIDQQAVWDAETHAQQRLVHLFRNKNGSYRFSGHNATGDPFDGVAETRKGGKTKPRPFDAIVDVGGEFRIVEPHCMNNKDPLIYLLRPGPVQHATMGPDGVVAAARLGWFGFRIVQDLANGIVKEKS